jgi:hypothetical protein
MNYKKGRVIMILPSHGIIKPWIKPAQGSGREDTANSL